MCYAKRYAAVLLLSSNLPPVDYLLQLPPQKRLNVMKSLTALSKYTGQYDRWQQIRKQYNLRWTTGTESITAMERFFNPQCSLDHMLQRVKAMIQVLPYHMGLVVRHALLTGLRCVEAVESVRLIQDNETFQEYYNPDAMTLSHYKFKEQFLRITKKAFLSYITLDNLQPIRVLGCRTPTYNAIRLTVKRHGLDMDMNLCRKIFASHLIKSGLDSNTVDMLQGRYPQSILVSR
jgi:hypothetical protein